MAAPGFRLFQHSRREGWPDSEWAVWLCSSQNGEYGGCTTEMKQTASAGSDVLVVMREEAEKGA